MTSPCCSESNHGLSSHMTGCLITKLGRMTVALGRLAIEKSHVKPDKISYLIISVQLPIVDIQRRNAAAIKPVYIAYPLANLQRKIGE